jgi:hypothetical protein
LFRNVLKDILRLFLCLAFFKFEPVIRAPYSLSCVGLTLTVHRSYVLCSTYDSRVRTSDETHWIAIETRNRKAARPSIEQRHPNLVFSIFVHELHNSEMAPPKFADIAKGPLGKLDQGIVYLDLGGVYFMGFLSS